jgi:phage baseplate assembly protein W
MKNEHFLGTGWSFPPTFDFAKGTVIMVSDQEDIEQSLHILMSTTLGERIQRSDYGCALDAMLFENITVTLLTKIKLLIEKAILMHEPRIQLDEVFFTSPSSEEGFINIELQYTIRTTNSRFNYVYPFYLKEGTYIKS